MTAPVRVVYLIQAYKLPELVVRLVRRLHTGHTTFLIHVDRKSDPAVFDQIWQPLAPLPGVHFMPRYVTNWGDITCVDDALRGFRWLIESKTDYDYAVLLSGQDYPIKSNHQIQDTLQSKPGMSYLDCNPLPFDGWLNGGMERLDCWHFFRRGRILRFPQTDIFPHPQLNRLVNSLSRRLHLRHRLPRQLKPYGGSNYWCLTRETVEYVHAYLQSNPAVHRFFRYVLYPTETFFQTILMSSPLRERIIRDNLRYIDWSKRGPNPKVLTSRDCEKFMPTDRLFARKFDPTVDPHVLDLIDRSIF